MTAIAPDHTLASVWQLAAGRLLLAEVQGGENEEEFSNRDQ